METWVFFTPFTLPTKMATQMSKKRKFVADGVFFVELNEVLIRELAEDGYSGDCINCASFQVLDNPNGNSTN